MLTQTIAEQALSYDIAKAPEDVRTLVQYALIDSVGCAVRGEW